MSMHDLISQNGAREREKEHDHINSVIEVRVHHIDHDTCYAYIGINAN